MRTFQEYLIDTYAIPFLEYVHSLDEQEQAELLSTLNADTLAILQCISEGTDFEAPNTAFNELRYDLNEAFQLDEGSSGIQRLKRKSGTRQPEEKVPPGSRSSTHLKMKRYYNSERIKSRGRKMSESSDLNEGSRGLAKSTRAKVSIYKKHSKHGALGFLFNNPKYKEVSRKRDIKLDQGEKRAKKSFAANANLPYSIRNNPKSVEGLSSSARRNRRADQQHNTKQKMRSRVGQSENRPAKSVSKYNYK